MHFYKHYKYEEKKTVLKTVKKHLNDHHVIACSYLKRCESMHSLPFDSKSKEILTTLLALSWE